MRGQRISELHPEYVFLGLLAREKLHGYGLYQLFRETLGGLWHISESQMYATLKRLEKRGWISGEDGGPKPGGRLLSITTEGHRVFDAWLLAPTPLSPRALRLEFLSRLFFAQGQGPLAEKLRTDQKRVLLTELRRTDPSVKGAIDQWAQDFRKRQIRTALEWIEGIREPISKIGYF